MKFVVTLILIGLAWALLSLLSKRGQKRRDDVADYARRATQKAAGVEQTVPCRVCGTYRAVSDRNPCDRDDCPYGEGA